MGRKHIQVNLKSGERLKLLRTEQGITQERLAEIIDFSVPHLSNVETGRKPISMDMVNAIRKAFPDYRDQWLLGEDDIKTFDDWKIFLDRGRERQKEVDEELLSAVICLAQSDEIQRKDDGGILIRGPFFGGTDLFVGAELSKEQAKELISQIRDFISMRIRGLFHPPFPGSHLMKADEQQGGVNHDTQE